MIKRNKMTSRTIKVARIAKPVGVGAQTGEA